jgi:hypothetical protein
MREFANEAGLVKILGRFSYCRWANTRAPVAGFRMSPWIFPLGFFHQAAFQARCGVDDARGIAIMDSDRLRGNH